MAKYDAKHIRNVVVVGHQSSGKTTLVESMAFVSKLIPQKGEVEKRNTLSDYNPDEQKRGASIQTAVIPMTYKDHKINVIDVPGNDDFISEVIGVAGVVKGAVLVVDASVGVQVGTVKHWNQLKKKNIPTFIFVNKMDKDEVKFDEVMADIKDRLGKNVISFCHPLINNKKFEGFVNVVDEKALVFNGKECVEQAIPADKQAEVSALHDAIAEEVAKTDDALLEKFFNGEQFSEEEIHNALRTAVLNDEIIPVIVGSATKNIGVQTLFDMFIHYLPSPADLKPLEAHDESGKEVVRATDENEPFSAYVFKTVVDPYSGTINILKVCSGVLHVGDEVYVNGGTQKVSMLYSMTGKKLDNVTELVAGDIGAVTRLEKVCSGNTLCSPKNITIYKPVKYPTAVIFKAIILSNKNDESKLGTALAKMQLEDPCIEVKRNNETKQLLLGGLSSSHIDFVIEKLKSVYKIDVVTEPMKVVYRESIKATAEGDGRYVKQSGGSGFYGVVKMRFEPAEENSFAEEIYGGAVPKNYFPAVEKGFMEALNSGLLAGFPVIGVKGVLIDGKYHPVDSNEQAFKMAGILAFKDAYLKCKPIILEPIMLVKVHVESKYTGNVMSDLNTRRARIQSIDEKEHGSQEIEALIPEAEILDYATQLKSLTQASGFFNREFNGYEELPEYLKDKVIRENKIENN